MKIYVSHATGFDFVKQLYEPIKNSKLRDIHDFTFPHKNEESVHARELIKSSDMVFAEVSFPSTGQGIELGWASLFNVPIVCFSRKGSKTSGSLKYVSDQFIEYDDADDLMVRLTAFLKAKQ